ncbi:MAG: hypothetical protein ACRDGV_02420 [Candidatus Limnocylindria bacterium]
MRVIRPAALAAHERRRGLLLAFTMLSVGVLGAMLAVLVSMPSMAASALMAIAAALGLGIGAAWLVRALRPDPVRGRAAALEALLGEAFNEDYTLLLAPRLPIRAAGLSGLLVGPPGVRVLTVREWEGRYRVRGRGWEFDAGRRGWIACRTNPSFELTRLVDGVTRWSADAGLVNVPLRGAIVFPGGRSRLVLEEPSDEIVTADNVPWWANRIGRLQRLDAVAVARFVERVIDAAEAEAARATTASPVMSRERQG